MVKADDPRRKLRQFAIFGQTSEKIAEMQADLDARIDAEDAALANETEKVKAGCTEHHVEDHPDHPPVDGGYRGASGDNFGGETAQEYCDRLYPTPAPGVSTVGHDTARELGAYAERRSLPTDSAARKALPLCAGAIDYFPDAFVAVFQSLACGKDTWSTDDTSILVYLADRDHDALLGACLDSLQDELVGPPTQCRSRNAAVRWSAALVEVARVSVYGNEKHNPGGPLHHARGKSMDHADCIARHTFDAAAGVLFDGPMRHRACRAWRAGALGQEAAEAEGAPLARGARLP